MCSSALRLISKQFENRFPPQKWNIYVFYFTDGENMMNDNETFIGELKKDYPEHLINFVGITQIYAYDYRSSILAAVEEARKNDLLDNNVRTAEIPNSSHGQGGDARNEAVLNAVRDLLGKNKVIRG
jgi:uncharacterized sporulation protein YeaH/YhbH (DUF444 family)